jgi:hypothetical protein
MSEPRNTIEGYEVENADPIPDDEDPGTGFGAGDRVLLDDGAEVHGGEEGIVQAIARGRGVYAGSLVVDVLVDGTDTAARYTEDEIHGAV